MFTFCGMDLKTYIESIGDEAAAARFGVKKRTAAAWRRGERTPRPAQADRIVAASPVTWQGIYQPAASQANSA